MLKKNKKIWKQTGIIKKFRRLKRDQQKQFVPTAKN